jgi:lauroyl/myristoyl acyltransferase
VGAALPVRVATAFAVVGGHLEWALRPGKRRVLRTNLAHALHAAAGSHVVRRAVRREIVNEARRSADLLWAIGRPAALLQTVEVVGAEPAIDVLRSGRGIVLAGIHLGGWEVAAAVPAAILPAPTSVIVADNWLAWAIQHVRAEAGLRMLYRTAPAIAAARLLRRGEVLLVLGDDAWGARPRSASVRFCDARARLPLGIATLARLGRAAIVPFAVLPDAMRTWRIIIDTPIDPPPPHADDAAETAVLQTVADRWTALIEANPERWSASFRIEWEPS